MLHLFQLQLIFLLIQLDSSNVRAKDFHLTALRSNPATSKSKLQLLSLCLIVAYVMGYKIVIDHQGYKLATKMGRPPFVQEYLCFTYLLYYEWGIVLAAIKSCLVPFGLLHIR